MLAGIRDKLDGRAILYVWFANQTKGGWHIYISRKVRKRARMKKFGLEDSKEANTPMTHNAKLGYG